jgi:hypothetical protein
MYKLLFCCLLLLTLVQLASAGLINSFGPQPSIGNFGYYSQCPPATCSFNFSIDTPATGSVDFTPAGDPITFNFDTGYPVSWYWNGGYIYYATFGYGGFFDMTGPDGLTFQGVVTSGSAAIGGLTSQVEVNYFGQWSDGQYAGGDAYIYQGGQGTYAAIGEEIAPEPSSIILLGTGFLALWGWGRKLMR